MKLQTKHLLPLGLLVLLVPGEGQTARNKQIAVRSTKAPTANWNGDSFAAMDLIKDAPYSAVLNSEGVKTATDGSHIPQNRLPVHLYRDSAGRIRKESTGVTGAPGAIEIDDPVEGARYAIDSVRQIAHRIRVPVRKPQPRDAAPPAQHVRGNNGPRIQVEHLGTKTIEGLETTGERTTIVWPKGSQQNAKPLTILTEKWTSPALRIDVVVKSSDPATSLSQYLTNVSRSEPDAALFQIPRDYKVVDDDVTAFRPPATQPGPNR